MKKHIVKPAYSKEKLEKKEQLAWKLASIACDKAEDLKECQEMVIDRMIDNASVAIASVNRRPIITARSMALPHAFNLSENQKGASLWGLKNTRVSPEWAAWANGTAVRELDFHDTFLAADYSHPGDNIPPLLSVAQHLSLNGKALIRGVLAAYEIQVSLVKSICLHEFAIDHIAHLGVSMVGGIASMLGLGVETTYQAIQQILHVTVSTRQSRKGEISSWKAYAPAHAGKLAIEAVDRAMRGENSPSPIYEGEDSFIAKILGGMDSEYEITLLEPGEPKRAILETYTKEHSAEYQSQAIIDLAFSLRQKVKDFSEIKEIILHTSHHTHKVIGTGANDPQKMDPNASRETLDHSIMYILAVALEDGYWHHKDSYTPERAKKSSTVTLWHKISTVEEHYWTNLYHHPDPNKKAFGGEIEIILKNGEIIKEKKLVANAHPNGERPFQRENYIKKFKTLTEGIAESEEQNRFITTVTNLKHLQGKDLYALNVFLDETTIASGEKAGIF